MKILEKILEPRLFRKLETAAKLYSEEDYNRILKHYDKPVLASQKSDVFRNILRICCLIRKNDPLWKSEYLACSKSGEFDKFLTTNDKKYIQFYIYSLIDSDLTSLKSYSDFRMNEVTDRIKSFYPYDNDQSETHSKLVQSKHFTVKV